MRRAHLKSLVPEVFSFLHLICGWLILLVFQQLELIEAAIVKPWSGTDDDTTFWVQQVLQYEPVLAVYRSRHWRQLRLSVCSLKQTFLVCLTRIDLATQYGSLSRSNSGLPPNCWTSSRLKYPLTDTFA